MNDVVDKSWSSLSSEFTYADWKKRGFSDKIHARAAVAFLTEILV